METIDGKEAKAAERQFNCNAFNVRDRYFG